MDIILENRPHWQMEPLTAHTHTIEFTHIYLSARVEWQNGSHTAFNTIMKS